ncbi:hypothetical protein Hdeb2414_s0914g00960711 [Helianthus debilis subsp. tardiflorus]
MAFQKKKKKNPSYKLVVSVSAETHPSARVDITTAINSNPSHSHATGTSCLTPFDATGSLVPDLYLWFVSATDTPPPPVTTAIATTIGSGSKSGCSHATPIPVVALTRFVGSPEALVFRLRLSPFGD